MIVTIHKQWLFFTQFEPKEIKWVKETMQWFTRSDKSLRNIEIGDLVQVSQSNHRKRGKMGTVTLVEPDQVTIQFKDATLSSFKPYHLVMMKSESLVYTTKSGQDYTFWGLYKLLKKTAPFSIELSNPIVSDYGKWPIPNDLLPGIVLEEFQIAGISKALTLKRGIIIIPTGGGKTELMLGILKLLEEKSLLKRAVVVVPSVPLSEQFVTRGRKRGFDDKLLGAIHGTRKDYDSKIVVAVLNSLAVGIADSNPVILDILRDSNVVLYDECFPGDQYIATSDGPITIGGLYKKWTNLAKSKIPFVLSYNEKLRIFEQKRIIKVSRKPIPNQLIQITCGLKKFVCTLNHKILTTKGWMKANELSISDAIIRSHYDNLNESHISCNKDSTKKFINLIKDFLVGSMPNKIGMIGPYPWYKNTNSKISTGIGVITGIKLLSNNRWINRRSPWVYDIEVQDNHNFIVCSSNNNSGFVAHNCHHIRSDTAITLINKINHVDYLVAFSGSPFLMSKPFDNPGDTVVWGLTGGPIFTVPHEHVRSLGLTSEPVVFMKPVGQKMLKYGGNFQKIYDTFIIKSPDRNKEIDRYTRRLVKSGFKVLILVQKKTHAEILMKMMKDLKIISVFGGKTGLCYNNLGELTEISINYDKISSDFDSGGWDIAIGSTVMDEGVDIPSIGAVIVAGSGKSRIKVLQRIGRGLRRKKVGRNRVYVLDFMDKAHVFLMSHSKQRLELYKEIQATIVEDEAIFNNMFSIHGKELHELNISDT